MKEFTRNDARNAIMDITRKASNAFDANHLCSVMNQSYLDARLTYINSVILDTIPNDLLKIAL